MRVQKTRTTVHCRCDLARWFIPDTGSNDQRVRDGSFREPSTIAADKEETML